MTGLQWIASEAWTTAIVLQTPSYMPFLAGTLGIAIRRGEIPGLRDFLLRIRPDNDTLSTQDNNLVLVSSYIFRIKYLVGILLNVYVTNISILVVQCHSTEYICKPCFN